MAGLLLSSVPSHGILGPLAFLAGMALVSPLLLGCERERTMPTSGTLVVGASGAGLAIATDAAQDFETMYPRAVIRTRRLDGFRATEALLRGQIGLALLPRRPVAEESTAARSLGVTLGEVRVADDGVAVVVDVTNPLRQVSMAQVRRIWSGHTRDWRVLGGGGGALLAFAPDPTTGTGGYLGAVLGNAGPPGQPVYFQPDESAVLREVGRRPDAIGFVSAGFLIADGRRSLGVRVLGVVPDGGTAASVPSQAALAAGDYPLTTPITAVTRGQPDGLAAGFIGFLTSDHGQRVVERLGFAPVSQAEYEVHLR